LTDIARVTSVDEKTIELVEALSNMHMIQCKHTKKDRWR